MNNKTLEYYLGLPYKVEIFSEEDGSYTAVIPELPGCVACGDTISELWEMIADAKQLWLEVALEDGDYIPEPAPPDAEEYSGRFVVRIPRSLHRHLAKRAEQEKTSLNTLVVTLLAEGMGRWAEGIERWSEPSNSFALTLLRSYYSAAYKPFQGEELGRLVTRLWQMRGKADLFQCSAEYPDQPWRAKYTEAVYRHHA